MKKTLLLFIVLIVLLAASVVTSVLLGGSNLPLSEVLAALAHPGAGGMAATIIWGIRIPRIVLGILVGTGLAVSGCAFQAILRNPLADPYTLGVSGGAALGATIGIISGLAAVSVVFIPGFAFLGAAACMAIVYFTASRRGFSTHTLILAGVILGFIFSSLVLLIFALSSAEKVRSAMLWLTGDLSSGQSELASVVAVFVGLGTAVLFLFSRELNVITLGEEKAAHLGVETEKVKKILFLTASFITGACVSAAGVIGFVGLLIPHLMRRFTGPDHRLLVPASALGGAIFLPLCDALARTVIAPVELPVGVITGIIGGIFFFVFLVRSSKFRIF